MSDLSRDNLKTRKILGRVLVGTLAVALFAPGCGSDNRAPETGSNRLHMVSVLYGKYLSAHEGETPQSEAELVKYVDANEPEILQRWGFRSAADIFLEVPNRPRLMVLYREPRERLQTEFVAIEEQKPKEKPDARSKWFAADVLGISQPLSPEEVARILAAVEKATANAEEPPGAEKTTGEKQTSS